jgi:Peptidyl-tRNA hydrolase PTH2
MKTQEDPIAVYLVVNGPLGLNAGKIASQAFQACQRLLRDSGTDPERRRLIAAWEHEGTRTICRVAETEAVFERVRREVPGITLVDEGIYGCAPQSRTIHASWPVRRSALPRMLAHKRVPLLVMPLTRCLRASGPGRSRTCTTPIKSRRLFQLSYRAEQRRDRQGSNLRRLAFQTSALPLSYGHVIVHRRSWSRTSGLLRIRQVLSR